MDDITDTIAKMPFLACALYWRMFLIDGIWTVIFWMYPEYTYECFPILELQLSNFWQIEHLNDVLSYKMIGWRRVNKITINDWVEVCPEKMVGYGVFNYYTKNEHPDSIKERFLKCRELRPVTFIETHTQLRNLSIEELIEKIKVMRKSKLGPEVGTQTVVNQRS